LYGLRSGDEVARRLAIREATDNRYIVQTCVPIDVPVVIRDGI